MKSMKKFIAILLSVLILTSFCSLLSSAAEDITDLSVTASVGEKTVTVKWWKNGNSCYLFLPSGTDTENLTLSFTASSDVTIDGKAVENNSTISLDDKAVYSLSCGDSSYSLYVFRSDSLPSVHITTESGSMATVHADKSHKEPANIEIYSEGQLVVEKELEYIKGRGNTTWTYAKKPYNIKFDKKISLFGMDKAKKWTLLANYVDKTLLRNYTALNLATELGIPFTSQHIFVDLYINNEYFGNYLLCESVEIGDGRIEINDLTNATEEVNPDIDIEKCTLDGHQESDYHKLKADTQKWVDIPNNPEDISGGYLLEYELPYRYVDEISGFITKRNQPIVIKEPEYASEAQVKYISELYQQFEDAIYSDTGYNSLNKHYSEYIDLDSIAKMYVFQELTKNLDAATTSFYIYKDAGSDKFVAAPVWDFDRALGSSTIRYGVDTGAPNGWWAGIAYHLSDNDVFNLPTMLNELYKKDDFFAIACYEWNTNFSPVINNEYISSISAFADKLASSAIMNALRWKTHNPADYNSVKQSYLDEVNTKLLHFIAQRKVFLDKGFSDSSVRIFYNSNGGTGNMFNESAVAVGDTVTLPKCTFTHSSMIFDCWNTAADGSGTSYLPGENFNLDSEKITFYAQWKEKPEEPTEPPAEPDNSENLNFFQKLIKSISDFFNRIMNFFKNLFR